MQRECEAKLSQARCTMLYALCVVLSQHPTLPGFPLHFKLRKVGSFPRHFTVSINKVNNTSLLTWNFI